MSKAMDAAFQLSNTISVLTATCASAGSASSTAAVPSFQFNPFHTPVLRAKYKPTKARSWRCNYCGNSNPDNHSVCGEDKFWGCGAPREK